MYKSFKNKPQKSTIILILFAWIFIGVFFIIETSSKFFKQWESSAITINSKSFYFTSNGLSDQTISGIGPQVSFKVRNYDGDNISNEQINYNVKVTLSNGSTVTGLSGVGSGTLAEDSKKENTITISGFPINTTAINYKIIVTSTSPFSKTLSATYSITSLPPNYFTSDDLTGNPPPIRSAEPKISFTLKNYDGNSVSTGDVKYNVSIKPSNGTAVFGLTISDSGNGTLAGGSNHDNTITITGFPDDDNRSYIVTATATSGLEKTLSATYTVNHLPDFQPISIEERNGYVYLKVQTNDFDGTKAAAVHFDKTKVSIVNDSNLPYTVSEDSDYFFKNFNPSTIYEFKFSKIVSNVSTSDFQLYPDNFVILDISKGNIEIHQDYYKVGNTQTTCDYKGKQYVIVGQSDSYKITIENTVSYDISFSDLQATYGGNVITLLNGNKSINLKLFGNNKICSSINSYGIYGSGTINVSQFSTYSYTLIQSNGKAVSSNINLSKNGSYNVYCDLAASDFSNAKSCSILEIGAQRATKEVVELDISQGKIEIFPSYYKLNGVTTNCDYKLTQYVLTGTSDSNNIYVSENVNYDIVLKDLEVDYDGDIISLYENPSINMTLQGNNTLHSSRPSFAYYSIYGSGTVNITKSSDSYTLFQAENGKAISSATLNKVGSYNIYGDGTSYSSFSSTTGSSSVEIGSHKTKPVPTNTVTLDISNGDIEVYPTYYKIGDTQTDCNYADVVYKFTGESDSHRIYINDNVEYFMKFDNLNVSYAGDVIKLRGNPTINLYLDGENKICSSIDSIACYAVYGSGKINIVESSTGSYTLFKATSRAINSATVTNKNNLSIYCNMESGITNINSCQMVEIGAQREKNIVKWDISKGSIAIYSTYYIGSGTTYTGFNSSKTQYIITGTSTSGKYIWICEGGTYYITFKDLDVTYYGHVINFYNNPTINLSLEGTNNITCPTSSSGDYAIYGSGTINVSAAEDSSTTFKTSSKAINTNVIMYKTEGSTYKIYGNGTEYSDFTSDLNNCKTVKIVGANYVAPPKNVVTLDISKGNIEIYSTSYIANGSSSSITCNCTTTQYVITGTSSSDKYIYISGTASGITTYDITFKDLNVTYYRNVIRLYNSTTNLSLEGTNNIYCSSSSSDDYAIYGNGTINVSAADYSSTTFKAYSNAILNSSYMQKADGSNYKIYGDNTEYSYFSDVSSCKKVKIIALTSSGKVPVPLDISKGSIEIQRDKYYVNSTSTYYDCYNTQYVITGTSTSSNYIRISDSGTYNITFKNLNVTYGGGNAIRMTKAATTINLSLEGTNYIYGDSSAIYSDYSNTIDVSAAEDSSTTFKASSKAINTNVIMYKTEGSTYKIYGNDTEYSDFASDLKNYAEVKIVGENYIEPPKNVVTLDISKGTISIYPTYYKANRSSSKISCDCTTTQYIITGTSTSGEYIEIYGADGIYDITFSDLYVSYNGHVINFYNNPTINLSLVGNNTINSSHYASGYRAFANDGTVNIVSATDGSTTYFTATSIAIHPATINKPDGANYKIYCDGTEKSDFSNVDTYREVKIVGTASSGSGSGQKFVTLDISKGSIEIHSTYYVANGSNSQISCDYSKTQYIITGTSTSDKYIRIYTDVTYDITFKDLDVTYYGDVIYLNSSPTINLSLEGTNNINSSSSTSYDYAISGVGTINVSADDDSSTTFKAYSKAIYSGITMNKAEGSTYKIYGNDNEYSSFSDVENCKEIKIVCDYNSNSESGSGSSSSSGQKFVTLDISQGTIEIHSTYYKVGSTKTDCGSSNTKYIFTGTSSSGKRIVFYDSNKTYDVVFKDLDITYSDYGGLVRLDDSNITINLSLEGTYNRLCYTYYSNSYCTIYGYSGTINVSYDDYSYTLFQSNDTSAISSNITMNKVGSYNIYGNTTLCSDFSNANNCSYVEVGKQKVSLPSGTVTLDISQGVIEIHPTYYKVGSTKTSWLYSGSQYILTGTTSEKYIRIYGNCTYDITFNNLNIDCDDYYAIIVDDAPTINLSLYGTNSISSNNLDCRAVQNYSGSTINILTSSGAYTVFKTKGNTSAFLRNSINKVGSYNYNIYGDGTSYSDFSNATNWSIVEIGYQRVEKTPVVLDISQGNIEIHPTYYKIGSTTVNRGHSTTQYVFTGTSNTNKISFESASTKYTYDVVFKNLSWTANDSDFIRWGDNTINLILTGTNKLQNTNTSTSANWAVMSHGTLNVSSASSAYTLIKTASTREAGYYVTFNKVGNYGIYENDTSCSDFSNTSMGLYSLISKVEIGYKQELYLSLRNGDIEFHPTYCKQGNVTYDYDCSTTKYVIGGSSTNKISFEESSTKYTYHVVFRDLTWAGTGPPDFMKLGGNTINLRLEGTNKLQNTNTSTSSDWAVISGGTLNISSASGAYTLIKTASTKEACYYVTLNKVGDYAIYEDDVSRSNFSNTANVPKIEIGGHQS